MNPKVIAAFATERVVLRQRLLDLGVPPSDIRYRLRAGDWVRLRRGAYTTREIWDAEDKYVGRPRLLARAAIGQMRRGWVLSHDSAAHELDLPILTPREPFVHITRPGWTNAWTEHGVKHHLARFDDDQLVMANGLPALDLARTAVDIARERGYLDGLVACDQAMNRGVSRLELRRAVEPMRHWPGSRAARQAVEAADAGAESVNESLGRHLVLEAGIGEPETQFPVATEEGVRWCDLRVGNHVIEVDGRVKYLPRSVGGLADSPDDAAWEDRRRERLIRDRRLVVTRVYWEDYWGDRRVRAIERIRADNADAVARFGPELDPRLAREAAAIRRRHGDRRRTA